MNIIRKINSYKKFVMSLIKMILRNSNQFIASKGKNKE